jgi:hypothetical protein
MRRVLIAIAAALAVASPAAAAGTTIQEMIDHGIVLIVADMNIDVTYTKDGKFTAAEGQVTGTYRVDGEKLCSTSNVDPTESCFTYPKDKKSGDTFDLDTPQGPVKIKIK